MENKPTSTAPQHRVVGRALDLLVATNVMGWKPTTRPGQYLAEVINEHGDPVLEVENIGRGYDCLEEVIFRPSTDIAHAWAVVQRMSEIEQRNAIWWNCTAGAFICIDIGDDLPKSLSRIMFDCPDKMPLAICLAALEAFGVPPNTVMDGSARPQQGEGGSEAGRQGGGWVGVGWR
jgi:hypothetical protein